MANSVDRDEKAHYEPSYLDLYYLQRYMFCSAGMKELRRLDCWSDALFVYYS